MGSMQWVGVGGASFSVSDEIGRGRGGGECQRKQQTYFSFSHAQFQYSTLEIYFEPKLFGNMGRCRLSQFIYFYWGLALTWHLSSTAVGDCLMSDMAPTNVSIPLS